MGSLQVFVNICCDFEAFSSVTWADLKQIYQEYCDVLEIEPGSTEELYDYLCELDDIDYEQESDTFYGLALKELWKPNKKSLLGKRMSDPDSSSSEESLRKKASVDDVTYIHPLLFINRQAINYKTSIDREQLSAYIRWYTHEKNRLSSYTLEDTYSKEIQVTLLQTLEQEKQSIEDLYTRPNSHRSIIH